MYTAQQRNSGSAQCKREVVQIARAGFHVEAAAADGLSGAAGVMGL